MTLTRIHNKVLDIFKLNPKAKTPKGWLIGAECPFCGSDEKFGIRLNTPNAKYTNHISYNCFRGSCKEKGGEFLLFKQLGILEWYLGEDYVKHNTKLENKITKQVAQDEQQIDITVPKATPPIGFKRISSHEYLEERGFEPWQFELYTIGTTRLMRKLRNYVIFLITENGENKGYVARSTKSKAWINAYNDEIKKINKDLPKSERKRQHLRYINEPGVDFGKLLYGIDEVVKSTLAIILVEGITDKANIDRWIYANDLKGDVVCMCTFGKKLSDEQRIRLLNLRDPFNITVIFMYDPDAINDEKRHGYELNYYVPDVKVGFLKDKDPGDLTFDEISDVYFTALDIKAFMREKVQKRQLKINPSTKKS